MKTNLLTARGGRVEQTGLGWPFSLATFEVIAESRAPPTAIVEWSVNQTCSTGRRSLSSDVDLDGLRFTKGNSIFRHRDLSDESAGPVTNRQRDTERQWPSPEDSAV